MSIRFKKEDVALIIISVLAIFVFALIMYQSLNEVKRSFAVVSNVNNVPDINNISNNNQKEDRIVTTTEWRCLGEDEVAVYPVEKGTHKWLGIPEYPLTIFVKNNNTGEEIFSFKIDNIRQVSRSVEVCKCGVYVVKLFNYDFQKTQKKLGYRSELWKYDYTGNGVSIILMSEKPDEFVSYYSSSFRIDPLERYVALIKGYYGKEYYSLIIKDLETKEDVFVLSHSKLLKQYPEMKGTFDFREWTKDGRYFYGAISAGAIVQGFFRIDTENWKYEVFEVPEWIGGGDQLNVETGWVTYHTDMVWTGIYDMTEAIKQERREQGIGTKFYLYNLFTKKKILVYETDEPIFFTKPKWISDTEVEYETEEGEKKVYELK